MTTGMQCETCRKFAPSTPPGWLYVVRPSAEPSFLSSLGLGQKADDPLTFCRVLCLAEWACVQAATSEPATGQEPG
jgi:hypothetical protein